MDKLYDVTIKCAINAHSHEEAAVKMREYMLCNKEEWMADVEEVTTGSKKEIFIGS